MKHTPPPWVIKRIGSNVYVESDSPGINYPFVCDMQATETSGHDSDVIMEANAILITAAPELLEALQRLFNCVPLSVEGPDPASKIVTSVQYWREAYDQARAAIVKATGNP